MTVPNLMIQGTMSGVGKSLIVAGLCRIFKQDGMDPAPFKSQNMALNSYITSDGLEMGRAQVMQAYAAGLEPSVDMNPILLKPTDDAGAQVIVNGHSIGNMSAVDYYAYKKSLLPVIGTAYDNLSSKHSPVIIEGAGSPAEINLKDNDIVNMGLAELVDAPVFLVGDIDRGGVFAQLMGTMMLLSQKERARVKGFIINKFRGDISLLSPGLRLIEKKTGVPVLGVIPYIPDLGLEDEDSLTDRFNKTPDKNAALTIAVIRLPRISNFSDFDPFEQNPEVSLVYTTDLDILKKADLIMIPGTKNTIADTEFLIKTGIADLLKSLKGHTPIFGICGGLQILGQAIEDPYGFEGGGCIDGLGMLPVRTMFFEEKRQKRAEGNINSDIAGIFKDLSGMHCHGYEIHMGDTIKRPQKSLPHDPENIDNKCHVFSTSDNVYGTYLHGIFDESAVAKTILSALASKKGVNLDLSKQVNEDDFRCTGYDRLARVIRENLNLELMQMIISCS
ncbi:MAG: cobyric acid synthase [Lachnospiraceae bacterium]|nr:cobyric acid synthase [Lachnospiraceae bacterium]